MDEETPRPGGANRVVVGVVATAVLAVIVAGAFIAGQVSGDDEDDEPESERDTAVVELAEVAPSFTFDGVLVYADAFTVVHRIAAEETDDTDDAEPDETADGVLPAQPVVPTPTAPPVETITSLPDVGDVIGPGETLFEADSRRITVLPGDEPATRSLSDGVVGPDVEQLERWLADEGFDPEAAMTVDDTYTEATATAVSAWQRSLGVDDTGVVALGDVVFVPAPLRVVATAVSEGDDVVDATPVVAVTSVEREVVVEVDADDRGVVAVGDDAAVELPSGQEATATIVSIRPSSSDDGAFTVTASIAGEGLPDADRTPVEVTVTGGTTSGLFVPAEAIVARDLGGYAVEVVSASGRTEFVAVEIGVVADRRVQVIAPTVVEGTVVIAP